jgi:hypothetical protein
VYSKQLVSESAQGPEREKNSWKNRALHHIIGIWLKRFILLHFDLLFCTCAW